MAIRTIQRTQAMTTAASEHCEGTVVVHEDRSFTCSRAGCSVTGSVAAVVTYHSRFVPCRCVFSEDGCPRCSMGRFVIEADRDDAPTTAD